MAGQKYLKILLNITARLVVLVITCENIGPITRRGLWPLVMTRTTSNIFQYFLPAMYYVLSHCEPFRII